MNEILRLEFLGLPPSVNHTYGSRYGHRYKSKEVKEWQQEIINEILTQWQKREPFTGRAELLIEFSVKDNRRWDIDNRVKALQDCLTMAEVLKDDTQIDSLHVRRNRMAEQTRTMVILTSLEE